MSKKTKNILLASLSLVVLIVATIMVCNRPSGTISEKAKSFAVEDTAAIFKIFIADGQSGKVLLERKDDHWMVNGKYEVLSNNIEDLLNCISHVMVKSPVAKSAQENINKRMATSSIKVEIYYHDHHIKIGNFNYWSYVNKKVYYLGQQTMDNLGNYAILEGEKSPCVLYLPGFRGFIRPKYAAEEDSWRTHNIVRLKLSQIKEVKSVDLENPQQSFVIRRSVGTHFDLFALETQQKIAPYDTLKLLDHLSDYRNLNYEMQEFNLRPSERDSILNQKFKEVCITDQEGKTTTIAMYRISKEIEEEGSEFYQSYNRDKFYAIFNGKSDEIYLCQFFVFDRIVQPLEYYFPGNTSVAIPRMYELEN